MNIRVFCESALVDLNKHKRDKDSLLLYYVEKRLNKSIESYQSDLISATDYLANRKLLNLARKIHK